MHVNYNSENLKNEKHASTNNDKELYIYADIDGKEIAIFESS